jgi:hypothetical protein
LNDSILNYRAKLYSLVKYIPLLKGFEVLSEDKLVEEEPNSTEN